MEERRTAFDSVGWCRDHLMAGCVFFPLFVFLAWLCAVVNEHHLYATLSEMVADQNTAEGKLFIPALFLPAIFFLISSYPYRLPNASGCAGTIDLHKDKDEEAPYDHLFVVLRHFGLNTGLILIAFVPTLQAIQSNAHLIQTLVHGVAASVAFASYVMSEMQVVCCNARLFQDERIWRKRSLAFTVACLLLCTVHKLSFVFLTTFADYSEAWTFRYEMLLGAGVMSGNLMVWTWSNPTYDPKRTNQEVVPYFATFPYLGVAVVIVTDLFSRDNKFGMTFMGIELVVLAAVSVGMYFCIEMLAARFTRGRGGGLLDAEARAGYGTAGNS